VQSSQFDGTSPTNIFNVPHSKEEYARKLQEFDFALLAHAGKITRTKAYAAWLKFPVKFMQGMQNSDVERRLHLTIQKNTRFAYRVRGWPKIRSFA